MFIYYHLRFFHPSCDFDEKENHFFPVLKTLKNMGCFDELQKSKAVLKKDIIIILDSWPKTIHGLLKLFLYSQRQQYNLVEIRRENRSKNPPPFNPYFLLLNLVRSC